MRMKQQENMRRSEVRTASVEREEKSFSNRFQITKSGTLTSPHRD